MKKFACLLLLAFPLGCQPAAEKPADTSAPSTTPAPSEPAAGGESNATSSLIDKSATKLVMSIEGMSCPLGCPPAVKSALESVEGVSDVVVDYDTKTATVSVDSSKFKKEVAVEALSHAGFTGAIN